MPAIPRRQARNVLRQDSVGDQQAVPGTRYRLISPRSWICPERDETSISSGCRYQVGDLLPSTGPKILSVASSFAVKTTKGRPAIDLVDGQRPETRALDRSTVNATRRCSVAEGDHAQGALFHPIQAGGVERAELIAQRARVREAYCALPTSECPSLRRRWEADPVAVEFEIRCSRLRFHRCVRELDGLDVRAVQFEETSCRQWSSPFAVSSWTARDPWLEVVDRTSASR